MDFRIAAIVQAPKRTLTLTLSEKEVQNLLDHYVRDRNTVDPQNSRLFQTLARFNDGTLPYTGTIY